MGLKSFSMGAVQRGIAGILCGLILLFQPLPLPAQDNSVADAPETKEAAPAEPAEGQAEPDPPADAPPAAEAPTEIEQPAATLQEPAEEKPPTPPGKKSLDEYKDLLKRHSVKQEYGEVIRLCDEIAQVYPEDESIQYYRTRAEKSLELQEKKARLKSIRDKSAGVELPEPTPEPAAATGPAEAVPNPAKTAAPAPPPPAPVAPVTTSSGSGLMSKLVPVLIGFMLAGGLILVFLGLTKFKKKKPATAFVPQYDDAQSEDAPPQQARTAPPAWDMPSAASSSDDDLFSPSSANPQVESGAGLDIFSELSASNPPRPTSRTEDTAEQAERFMFFQEEPGKAQAPMAAAQRPHVDEPVRFDLDSSAPVSFETPKPKAAPKAAPWTGSEELDSFPMLKMDPRPESPPQHVPTPGQPSAASASASGASSKAPWDSRSNTATDKGKQPPLAIPSDTDSLPAFDLGSVTAASAGTKTAPGSRPSSSTDFPAFASKPGEPAAPSFAEMNLNAIKSPEFSETITDLDQFKAADTNPGFDVSGSKGTPASVPATPALDLDLPQMPDGESTLILNKSQLSQDPDLFLQSAQFGSSRSKPAPQPPPERFKEFKADETIAINFGGESQAPPASSEKSAESPTKPRDNFDRERDMGQQAFKDADWDKAVYHLSIAAALRPEATEIKEQLRRARRMRKERESGGPG